jgi:glycosyltransferase involved in cell wall biosynthesis
LLRGCIESLLSQTLPPERYEVVVVDDGSGDDTWKVFEEFEVRSGAISFHYLRPKENGLNFARNAGLSVAKGDPIVFLDDDVVAPPVYLKAIYDGSCRHPSAACFTGPVRLRINGKPPRFCSADGLDGEMNLGDKEAAVQVLIGANMIVRRTALQSVGHFSETMKGFGGGDETEWVHRLLSNGGEIVYLPDAWVWHIRNTIDLRMYRLMRKNFLRGREQVIYSDLVSREMRIWSELVAIPRFLAHAAWRQCAGGLLSASVRAGRVWQLALRNFISVSGNRSGSGF